MSASTLRRYDISTAEYDEIAMHLAKNTKPKHLLVQDLVNRGVSFSTARHVVDQIEVDLNINAKSGLREKIFDEPYHPSIDETAQLGAFRPQREGTYILMVLLTLHMVILLGGILASSNQRSLLIRLKNDPTSVSMRELETSDNTLLAISTISTIIGVLGAIAFLRWFFVAHRNTEAFSVYEIRYKPFWTWLGFIVPILFLWRPWQVATDIWNASNPDIKVSQDNRWKHKDSLVVDAWWISFIGNRFIGRLLAQTTPQPGDPIEVYLTSNLAQQVSLILTIFPAITALYLVYKLSDRQYIKYKTLYEVRSSDKQAWYK